MNEFEDLRDAQRHLSPRTWRDEAGEGLDYANKRLQLTDEDAIARVVHRGDEFDLYLADGRVVHAGGDLLDPRKFDKAIAPVLGRTVPYFTPKEFRGIADAMLSACERQDLGGDDAEEAREWLAEFVDDATGATFGGARSPASPGEAVELADAAELYAVLVEDRAAFYGSDDRLYVRVGKVLRWVNQEYRLRVTDRSLRRRLGALGFEKPRNREGQLAARDPGSGRTAARRFLASEPGFRP